MKGKGVSLTVSLLFIIIFTTSFYSVKGYYPSDKLLMDTIKKYNDGVYEGKSQSLYRDEPYWGIVRLTIKEGLFTDVKFSIRDSVLHEPFDSKYEKHFEGNPEYIQQSRNDWKGVQTYPEKLTGNRDIKSVDAMSGATWSYNIFKASLEEALKNSK